MEVIVVWGTPAALAAKRATTTIPILIGAAGDVVNTGLISNVARPEANLTGFVALNVELEEKRLELLKEVIPTLSRVAVLPNSANPLNQVNLNTARQAASRLGVTIEVFDVKSNKDVERALAEIRDAHPDAALLASDMLLLSERIKIIEAMATGRIPAIYPFKEYADAGGYSPMAPIFPSCSNEQVTIWIGFCTVRSLATCRYNKQQLLNSSSI